VGRLNNFRKIEGALRMLEAAELPFELSVIYGLPEQTRASFGETLRWVERVVERSAGRAVVRAWPLMLLRGTALNGPAARRRYGLVESAQLGVDVSGRVGSGIPNVVASATFDFDDWQAMHAMAEPFNRVATLSLAQSLSAVDTAVTSGLYSTR
jgi:hypothetical protein